MSSPYNSIAAISKEEVQAFYEEFLRALRSDVNVHEFKKVAAETDSRTTKSSVADEYERKQRDEIVRALAACKGRVDGADGAAARLEMNRTTLLSRMKKFGIYAKQYA